MDSVIARLDNSVFSMLESKKAPRIKISGIGNPMDINYVNRVRPDYIGLVFDPEDSRYVDPDVAAELKQSLSPAIKAAGMFKGQEIKDIVSIAEKVQVDLVELHGDADNTYINTLRARLHSGIPIIKAFKVASESDLTSLNSSTADYVLIDNYNDNDTDNDTEPEETFNADLLRGAGINKPLFIAGGIRPDNVRRAIHIFNPDAVDAGSSLDTDGCKDLSKMKKFVSVVRSVSDEFVD